MKFWTIEEEETISKDCLISLKKKLKFPYEYAVFSGNLTGNETHRLVKFFQSHRYMYKQLPNQKGWLVINYIEDPKFFENLNKINSLIDDRLNNRNLFKPYNQSPR